MVRTADSDVVVIAVRCFNSIEKLAELWIAFATGKEFRYIPAHEISVTLGPQRSNAVPLFHAFTGSDTTSTFYGIGKNTAWNLWLSEIDFEFTNCFEKIIQSNTFDEDDIKVIEKFVVRLYDKNSRLDSVNDARKILFPKKNRFDSIPPTIDFLIEHLKRTIYQGSLIWCRSTQRILDLPSPIQYGWKRAGTGFVPHWTASTKSASSHKPFIKCGCKTVCEVNPKTGKARCKCKKNQLECTAWCTYTCQK